MIFYFLHMRQKLIALVYGLICHGLFLCAALLMFICLFTGFSGQLVPSFFHSNYVLNVFLLLQFPLFHSFLLTKSGRLILRWFYSDAYRGKLDTTVYATIASVQLIFLFLFWTPSEVVLWIAPEPLYYFLCIGYFLGWLMLSISSIQAGFGVQTGSLGWISLYKGVKVKFPDMPCSGLFKIIRHPIYFSFCVILWVSPYLTVDKVVVASLYSLYCFLAPLLKEKRYIKIYGDRFRNYQLQTPYFFPKIEKYFNKNSK